MTMCRRALHAFIRRLSVTGLRRQVAQWVILALATPVLPAYALVLTTEENVPFNYQDGNRITGISTDILLEMARRTGIPMEIRILPWARAYRSALNYPDTCVYSTVRLPEREALFKWIGPLTSNKWALFAKNDFRQSIQSINDARHYRIGGVTMDAKSLYLQSLGFHNMDLVPDDNLNFAKLLVGRIDLWISGLYRDREAAQRNVSKAIKPVLIVREVDYFLACNPQTAKSTVKALKQALQALQKEGFVESVAEQYAPPRHISRR